jgi:hypothetical protein
VGNPRDELWFRVFAVHRYLGLTAYGARKSYRGTKMMRAYGARIFADESNLYRRLLAPAEIGHLLYAIGSQGDLEIPWRDDRRLALTRITTFAGPLLHHRLCVHASHANVEILRHGVAESWPSGKEALLRSLPLPDLLCADVLAALRPVDRGASLVEGPALRWDSVGADADGVTLRLVPDAARAHGALFDDGQEHLRRYVGRLDPGSLVRFAAHGAPAP